MTLGPDDGSVRLHILREAATTGRVPQAPAIANALGKSEQEVRAAIKNLAAERILMLAPNDGMIWAAAPFCATPSPFYVTSNGVDYSAICIWDALGIPAVLHQDAVVHTVCGDCGDAMTVKIRDGNLVPTEGIIHFGVPARHWWDNIGFT